VGPYLEKNPSEKRAGGVVQGVDPEFKPQYREKTKKRHVHYTIIQNNQTEKNLNVCQQ
jgi:hypothetical protein